MLEKEMLEAADNLDFERAAKLRDKLLKLRETPILSAPDSPAAQPSPRNKPLGNRRKPRRKTRSRRPLRRAAGVGDC